MSFVFLSSFSRYFLLSSVLFSLYFFIFMTVFISSPLLYRSVRAGGAYRGTQLFAFLPRYPALMRNQGLGFTLIGLVLQFADALVFVFLGKMFTWTDRWLNKRPIWARMGKRTLVIVDTPCVHQLLETFVSKLYAQSYSFCSIEVSLLLYFCEDYNSILECNA